MSYTTIFKTKPKKENKNNFCNRICDLLSNISVVDNNDYIVLSGKKMIDYLFKYSSFNTGYVNIDDILKEANENYNNIFNLCKQTDNNIWDDELLANIEIIVNCFYNFKNNVFRSGHFGDQETANRNIKILFDAIRAFLLSNGYKLVENNGRLNLVENEIAVDIEEIENEKLRNEIISFYDYKNANDVEEKKKIMLILIGKLESRKNDIDKILGSRIADMLSNYYNNLDLRHNNINEEYKKYYNKTVAELSNEEKIKWYDYVFAFMINIYLSIDKLKDININGGYK